MGAGLALVVLLTAGGALAGGKLGDWYLHETVPAPELETAIYPGVGAVIGGAVALAAGLGIAYLLGRKRSDEED